ncbi:MAG TPA: porin [Variovorax sp.]|nr:porin [Variovorax sp.]
MQLRTALAAPLLCAAAGAATAQSQLSISGLIDIGLYRDTNRVWQLGPIQRSNIAFGGVEDLGGGLAATFMLNQRFETDTGQLEQVGKPFFHAEPTVGLKGTFGSIRLGRALDAMYSQDWQFDAWGNYDRIASPAWDIWHYNYPSDPMADSGSPDLGRLNNGVFYDSPSFHGLNRAPEHRRHRRRAWHWRPGIGSATLGRVTQLQRRELGRDAGERAQQPRRHRHLRRPQGQPGRSPCSAPGTAARPLAAPWPRYSP